VSLADPAAASVALPPKAAAAAAGAEEEEEEEAAVAQYADALAGRACQKIARNVPLTFFHSSFRYLNSAL